MERLADDTKALNETSVISYQPEETAELSD
jgi:hypothetical protein